MQCMHTLIRTMEFACAVYFHATTAGKNSSLADSILVIVQTLPPPRSSILHIDKSISSPNAAGIPDGQKQPKNKKEELPAASRTKMRRCLVYKVWIFFHEQEQRLWYKRRGVVSR
jgi:hypothetical protein